MFGQVRHLQVECHVPDAAASPPRGARRLQAARVPRMQSHLHDGLFDAGPRAHARQGKEHVRMRCVRRQLQHGAQLDAPPAPVPRAHRGHQALLMPPVPGFLLAPPQDASPRARRAHFGATLQVRRVRVVLLLAAHPRQPRQQGAQVRAGYEKIC